MSAPLSQLCVVLVRPAGGVNIGMAARACANQGVEDLRLVSPQVAPDDPLCVQYAVHAAPLLRRARLFERVEDAVADCVLVAGMTKKRRERGLVPSLALRELPELAASRPSGPVALVFGNEADGLRREELAPCQIAVHLETAGAYDSYNLSHAVAVALYGLRTAPPVPGEPTEPGASQAMLADLHRAWLEALDLAGYFRRTDAARFAPALRRMLQRLHLNVQDVHSLRGMLAQLVSRLKQS